MDMLIGLDMDEVEKAPMEELVKIIQVMNDVIGDAKKQMKMTSIETRSKVVGNSKMKMEMPVIDQGERNVFSSKQMAAVDEDARERAERAFAKAH